MDALVLSKAGAALQVFSGLMAPNHVRIVQRQDALDLLFPRTAVLVALDVVPAQVVCNTAGTLKGAQWATRTGKAFGYLLVSCGSCKGSYFISQALQQVCIYSNNPILFVASQASQC